MFNSSVNAAIKGNKDICLWECTFSFPFATPPSVWVCHRLNEKNHTQCVCFCVFLRKRESIFPRVPEWRHSSGHQGYLTPRTQTVRGRREERRKNRRKEGKEKTVERVQRVLIGLQWYCALFLWNRLPTDSVEHEHQTMILFFKKHKLLTNSLIIRKLCKHIQLSSELEW